MTKLTEDEAWANYDRLVKDGATGQYLDETRAATRAVLRASPVADTAGIDAAWREAADAAKARGYGGFGVAADGPGYVAWYGHEEREVVAWSEADPDLPNYDPKAGPAAALLALAAALRTPKPEGER